jgi:hypothetical protein
MTLPSKLFLLTLVKPPLLLGAGRPLQAPALHGAGHFVRPGLSRSMLYTQNLAHQALMAPVIEVCFAPIYTVCIRLCANNMCEVFMGGDMGAPLLCC